MGDEVERKAEELARLAADRAAVLARIDAEKTTQAAVDRAVKDANVDRDLREHSRHLEAINGSQRDMANSLQHVEQGVEELAAAFQMQIKIQEALADAIKVQHTRGISRRTLWLSALGVLAAYLTLLGLLATSVH